MQERKFPEGPGRRHHRAQGGKDLRQQTEDLVRRLLLPENRRHLEQFRFHGSLNRVYRIPLNGNTDDFVIVKVPPGWRLEWRKWLKCHVRNLVYGEHEVAADGWTRATNEIERYREWQEAGLRVPEMVETELPGIRVIRGLPYPTLYTVLASDIPSDAKLEAVGKVTVSLSHQHEVALARGQMGLLHNDPGPWNVMFDQDTGTAYWYDLEHRDEYGALTIEARMVSGLRTFLYGVLDQLEDRLEDVVETVVANYPCRSVLWGVIENAKSSRRARILRLANRFGLKQRQYHREQRVACTMAAALRRDAQ